MRRSLFAALAVCFVIAAFPPAGFPAADGQKAIPDYSLTPRSEIPVELTWRIEDLYPTFEAWEQDRAALADLVAGIDGAAKDWTGSAQKMLAMFELQDEIYIKGSRLFRYILLQSDVDLANTLFQALRGELQAAFVQIGSALSFIEPDLLKMSEETLEGYLASEPRLEPYRFTIKETLRSRAHILPEEQERIMTMTGLFGGAPSRASSFLNDVDMPHPEATFSDGKTVPLNYANYMRYRASNDPGDRTLAMRTFWANHVKYENTQAALLDGEMKRHLFGARVRGYADCLEASLFGNDIDPAVYHRLIASVREHLPLFFRYMRLKGELMGLADTMRYEDVYGSAVPSVERSYTYDEAQRIILAALKPLGKEYEAVLREAFGNRWIDVYPNKNKQSGAYSGGVYGLHSYVKMNYDGKYDAVSTLAHELGHAVHSNFANAAQPFSNAGYPLFLAEIASTFNETLLLKHMLKNEKDDLFKLWLIDQYLVQVRSTIYRQTMFAEYELAMHRRVEEDKTLTPDWLSATFLDLTKTYYGHDEGVARVDDYIRNEWSAIPHFYRYYYVYQYSTGMIASMALVEQALKSNDGVEKYLALLKAGGSDSPLALLKKAGVDMTTPEPSKAAFRTVEGLVAEMEKIVARLRAQKRI
jgi:oligoendopeptidase F